LGLVRRTTSTKKNPLLTTRQSSWSTKGGNFDASWHTIWDFFIPAYTCPWDNQRVGRFGDGGKWICGQSKYMEYKERPLVVYSFGVRDDSSFEEELLKDTNAEIVAVDFSVDSVRPPCFEWSPHSSRTDIGVM
jgi:hypothetical protein